MRKLIVRLRTSPGESLLVGTLAEEERRVYFEHAPVFLATGLQLSPFKLPARPGLWEHVDRRFGPLPGLFDDSLPDGWGLLLMDRHFRRQGRDLQRLSPLDRLAWLGTTTMGALTYHPPEGLEQEAEEVDLEHLGRHAEDVFEGDAAEVLPELLRAGGSPGGARPKALIGLRGDRVLSGEGDLPDGHEHWMVKFAARADLPDAGPIEHAYAGLATAAGIDMPSVRLFSVAPGRAHFGVRRFDRRPGNRRVHVHTFANMIHADFRIPSLDYADLFKLTRILTRNHQDVLRLFRRMAFNVAAHVRDDHSKNFAFLLGEDGNWTLTPAYDLTWSEGPGGEHSMTLLGEGKGPTREHCLKLASQFGVEQREATAILDEVNAALDHWPTLADESSVSRKAIAAVGQTLRTL